jgi:predicted Na+-dependent transporter
MMNLSLLLKLYIPLLLIFLCWVFAFVIDRGYLKDRARSGHPALFLLVVGFLINKIAKIQDKLNLGVFDAYVLGDLLIALAFMCYLFFSYRYLFLCAKRLGNKKSDEKV